MARLPTSTSAHWVPSHSSATGTSCDDSVAMEPVAMQKSGEVQETEYNVMDASGVGIVLHDEPSHSLASYPTCTQNVGEAHERPSLSDACEFGMVAHDSPFHSSNMEASVNELHPAVSGTHVYASPSATHDEADVHDTHTRGSSTDTSIVGVSVHEVPSHCIANVLLAPDCDWT